MRSKRLILNNSLWKILPVFSKAVQPRGTTSSLEPAELIRVFALLPVALLYPRDGTTAGVWEWGDLDFSVPGTNGLHVSAWESEKHLFADQKGQGWCWKISTVKYPIHMTWEPGWLIISARKSVGDYKDCLPWFCGVTEKLTQIFCSPVSYFCLSERDICSEKAKNLHF